MGAFFASWQLWEQMTFVLGCAIVIVFCLGLVKLWTTNRIMHKRELIDIEKKARLEEMRRTGLNVKRANAVPFGVRAIQSGIEVEGIWISRPPSPDFDEYAKLASSTTLVGIDSESSRKGKGKGKDVEDSRSISATTYKQGQSDGSYFPRVADSDPYDSSPAGTPTVSQFPKQQHTRAKRSHDSDSSATMDGHTRRTTLYDRPMYETYVPTSAPQGARKSSQRSVESASGASVASSSHSSSHSSRLYGSKTAPNRSAYSAVSQASPELASDPFETPLRTPTGFSTLSLGEQASPLMSPRDFAHPAPPDPTFGPGDLKVNRKSRRVNQGFEVLPAGTFVPQESRSNTSAFDEESLEEQPRSDRISRISNKLRKKSFGQTQSGGRPF